MAYGTIVASVSKDSVAAYRANRKAQLDSSMSFFVSHLLAYWIQLEPLGNTLGKCINGGERLSSRLWHSLRAPPIAWSRFGQSPFHLGRAHVPDVADAESFVADFRSQLASAVWIGKASSVGSLGHLCRLLRES